MSNRPAASRYTRIILIIVAIVLVACAAGMLAYRAGFAVGGG